MIQATLLDQLQDIRLPDTISAWPPGPAWWLLALALPLLLWLGRHAWHRYRQHRYRRQARRLLQAHRRAWRQHRQSQRLLTELNQLLRRTALQAYPSARIAGLQGRAWLRFLDRTGRTTAFSQGCGQALAEGPYRPPGALSTAQADALIKLVERWIKRHR